MSNKPLKDHREIGRDLDLFMFHEYAPGAIFWLPKGWTIYKTLVEFIRSKTEEEGYQEISSPVMVKNELFKKSGHWKHFGQVNMFNLAIYDENDQAKTAKEKFKGFELKIPEVNYTLKPMNCPEAALVFASKTRSYNDLPIRLSEFGTLHRRELSGVLGGLLRVRQFIIDDAHLFIRPDQIGKEIQKLLTLVISFYKSLGFEPRFYLATKPDKAMGDSDTWKQAEKSLEVALKGAKVDFGLKEKDGAFYGPKIDIHIYDSQKRDWQLATIQLDFQIPQSMGLSYIDRDGKRSRPVMIHRGIFGSIERFIGILLEHTQGNLPLWLSPTQAIILPISDKHLDYAQKISKELESKNIRINVDQRNETLQAKIRDATLVKIPYLLIVGEKEEKSQTVAVRTRDGKDLNSMPPGKFIEGILKEIENKT